MFQTTVFRRTQLKHKILQEIQCHHNAEDGDTHMVLSQLLHYPVLGPVEPIGWKVRAELENEIPTSNKITLFNLLMKSKFQLQQKSLKTVSAFPNNWDSIYE
jgi:hypothetical protein